MTRCQTNDRRCIIVFQYSFSSIQIFDRKMTGIDHLEELGIDVKAFGSVTAGYGQCNGNETLG